MAYRSVASGRDVLSGEGARRFGGRWNPANAFPVVYLAHPHEACVAEVRRNFDLAAGEARPAPRTLATIHVHDLQVLDLTTEEQLAAVGLSRADIERDEHRRCQDVGEVAHFLGLQGIHAPSATSQGFVIAAFSRRAGPQQLEVVTEEGQPLEDLFGPELS